MTKHDLYIKATFQLEMGSMLKKVGS